MGSCTDLATKPEVAAKIDKAEKPVIIKASAAAAVPSVVAIVATYADEAAAIAKEALALAKSGLALAKNALGQIAKFLGGLANILSIIGLLATQAQLLILNNDVRNLQSQLRQVQNIATGAAFRAEEAIRTSNTSVAQANTAIAKSNEAIATANGVASQAQQASAIASAANSEAIRARSEAIAASIKADEATRTANYASREANTAITRANTAIIQSDRAETKANAASENANAAAIKANAAIIQSNANVQELANLKTEVAQLKREIASKDIGLAVLRAAIATVGVEVADKESKGVVRTVKEATITNAGSIRDINGHLVGIPSQIGKVVGELGVTLTKTFDQKLADGTKEIRAGIGGGGISIEGAKEGVFRDLFGNTKANSQLKEVIDTEVTTQTKALEKVNTEQYTDLKSQVAGIPLVLGGIVTAGIVTGLKPFSSAINQTVAQTAPAALSQAAAAGVCSTTAPGGCMNKNILQPINKNISDYINAAGTAASVANNAILLRMQGVLDTVKKTTDVIKGTTNATLGTVTHAKHGLESIQKFADTAWKATHADKILNGITTALVLHNAVMLSGNLAQTVGEAGSSVLSAMGIKDSDGDAIDVNSVIKTKMTALISSVIGSANYAALTKKIAAANRIYQSAANVLDLTRNLFDSARNVAELTAENTGKIGNALRESGVVYEDAYSLMLEKVNPQNQAMRRLAGLSNTLQALEQGASAISEISSEVVETKDNITELKAERKQLENETKLILDTKKAEKDTAKADSQATTELAKIDFAKDEKDD